MALKKPLLISLLPLLWIGVFLAPNGFSDLPPEEASVDNLFGVGGRAMGMGGAHIAVAEDFSALWWNPAGLARVRRIELSGGLVHQRDKTRTPFFDHRRWGIDSHTRFGSGGITLPIPTYRGSLVFALGFNRIQNFDSSLKFARGDLKGDFWEEGSELRSGGLHTWGLGAAIDLSPTLSAGATVMIWGGREDYTWKITRDTSGTQGIGWTVTNHDYSDDGYRGLNLKFGLLFRANRYLTFGWILESPLKLTIEQDWTAETDSLIGDSLISITDYGYYKYKLSLPYKFGLGARLTLPYLILAADLNYTDWSQTEYKYPLEDVSNYNPYMGDAYRDVLSGHIGAEVLVPKLGVKFRLGYYRDPIPYRLKNIRNEKDFFTCGLGFLMGKVMTLDFALVHSLWETSSKGLDERHDVNRAFLTVGYRF